MSTYLEVRTRVAEELDRTDLASTDHLANAVLMTIKRYEGTRLYFNEARDLTFTTVAGQALYTSADASWIPTVLRLDEGYVTVGGQFRLLCRADPFTLEYLSDNSASEGEPYDWAYYNQNVRLYPVPDTAYAVRFYGLKRLATLVEDTDTNAWTTDAEDLLVAGAKRWLCQHVTRDLQFAEVMKLAEDEALTRLQREHVSKAATNTIIPMGF